MTQNYIEQEKLIEAALDCLRTMDVCVLATEYTQDKPEIRHMGFVGTLQYVVKRVDIPRPQTWRCPCGCGERHDYGTDCGKAKEGDDKATSIGIAEIANDET